MQYTDDERLIVFLILNSDFWILLLQNEVLQEPLDSQAKFEEPLVV